MALIRQHASALLDDAHSGRLVETMKHQARLTEVTAGVSEVASWSGSLKPFLTDLVDASLGHVEVLLEHKLPYSPKRADVILCGTHPRTGEPSYVVVELKQWTDVISSDGEIVWVRHLPREVLHPVEQVRRYCRQLVNFTPILAEKPDSVSGVSYMHNASDSGVWQLRRFQMDEYGQLFTSDSKALFIGYLRGRLSTDPSTRDAARPAADRLLDANLGPSKPLMAVAAKEIRERSQFVLLDEQQVAYRTVMTAVEAARASRKQTVVIVAGGPGSGKSVIALSLLGDLLRQGRTAIHATGSKAFTPDVAEPGWHTSVRNSTNVRLLQLLHGQPTARARRHHL